MTSHRDVYDISNKLGRPWSEIENILVDDVLNRQVTVFYIPDGSSKKYQHSTFRHRPRHVLEQFFLDDIWARPLKWDWVWATVKRFEEGTVDDHYLLTLEARVDGFTRYAKIRLSTLDLMQSQLGDYGMFAFAWEGMIQVLDDEYKTARYGSRRSIFANTRN